MKDKKREREKQSKSRIQRPLRARLFSFMAKPKNFKDKNFLSRMPELK